MNTYHMGRFTIKMPVDMKQTVQSQRIRHAEVNDFEWSQKDMREKERMEQWRDRINDVNALEKPRGVKKNIIQEVDLDLGQWSKGVQYYGDYIIPQRHFWSVLVDYGKVGVWLTVDGVDDQLSVKNLKNILRHYSSPPASSKEAFHLKHGIIDLPYMEQEETYARFEGHPLNLKVEVEMEETYEVKNLGIGERLAAAILTRYAPGVEVKKVRSCNRTAAGLDGEELVMKMSASGEETQIHFYWEYQGKVDSGEQPEIRITMETGDGDLEDKLKVWDAIIDSFKPVYP